jgi:hypothetical protein
MPDDQTPRVPPPVFVEEKGLVLFDIAACPLPGSFTPEAAYRGIWNEWVAETAIPGYTGTCYYRWGGPDLKWNAGCGPLSYWFFIDEPGVYRMTCATSAKTSLPAGCGPTAPSSASTAANGIR